MPVLKSKSKSINPAATIVLSFATVIVIGSLLLMLPFSSASGKLTDPFTAFFTAVSSTCVTGIVLVDTGTYWSVFGQIVILLMVQIGSLGFITLVSFFNFLTGKKMELHSIQAASESVNSSGFYDVKQLLKYVVMISGICEIAGALLLMITFVPKYGVYGIYLAVFMSVSAFCSSGLDILGAVEAPYCGLVPLASDPIVMLVVPTLVVAGGLGFLVWMDIIAFPNKKRISLQSKIVLVFTAALIFLGAFLTVVTEWGNPATIGDMSLEEKIGNGFFYSIVLRTAGFNIVDPTAMNSVTKLWSILFMFIGSAPGSTGGGIKITTFAIIVMTVVSVIKNKDDTIIMNRRIDKESVYKSLAITILAAAVTCVAAAVLFYSGTEAGIKGIDAAFEAVAAISTTGITMGVAKSSGFFARAVLSLTMFIGRVGPVSFAISLSVRRDGRSRNEVYPEGKLMVG